MRLPPSLSRADVVALERRFVWPPYTPSERHESQDPLVVVHAEGAWLEDADGRRYLDAGSSWWSATLGHRHPRLVRALSAQADALLHVAAGGATHAPVALLAAELAAIAPEGLERTHFSDDGSTAIEVAVKIAFQYWQQNGRPSRRRFVALTGAYHGDTLGAASLASIEEFAGVFGPLLFEVLRPPPPEAGAEGWERLAEHVESLLRTRGHEIAAVVVEPLVQGASGMRMHPKELLVRLREATRAADTFLIADEVFVGYGRTGTMWACEQAGIAPDLLCLGKGYTAGVLPMAATLASARIYDGFRGGTERAFLHGHTFCGHALGAAVAREVLAIYRDEAVLAGIPARATAIAACFARLAEVPGVLRTRALGTIGALDVGTPGYGGSGLGWAIAAEARARGVHLRPLGDTVYVAPPLNVPMDDLARLLDGVEDSVRAALGAAHGR